MLRADSVEHRCLRSQKYLLILWPCWFENYASYIEELGEHALPKLHYLCVESETHKA